MNSFERFRDRNSLRMVAENNNNARFIFNGYPSTVICSGNEKHNAAVVNKQEQDLAYIYTNSQDQLELGSVWSVKGLSFIIAEEVVIIKNVNWRKYKAFKCNVDIGGFRGFFLGPKKRHIDVSLKQDAILFSNQEPVLILPSSCNLNIGDRLVIQDRGWKIVEIDNISTIGITYYSLAAATVSKDVVDKNHAVENKKDVVLENKKPNIDDVNNVIEVYPNEIITLKSDNGYLSYAGSTNIEVTEKTRTTVSFKLPFGVNEAKITTKQAGEKINLTIKTRGR